jgi:hypothetical protein
VTTWTAAVSSESDTDQMTVAIIENEQQWNGTGYEPAMTDKIVLNEYLPVRLDDPDKWNKAERAGLLVLAHHQWGIAGWDTYAGNAIYGTAIPLAGNPLREQWTPEDEAP